MSRVSPYHPPPPPPAPLVSLLGSTIRPPYLALHAHAACVGPRLDVDSHRHSNCTRRVPFAVPYVYNANAEDAAAVSQWLRSLHLVSVSLAHEKITRFLQANLPELASLLPRFCQGVHLRQTLQRPTVCAYCHAGHPGPSTGRGRRPRRAHAGGTAGSPGQWPPEGDISYRQELPLITQCQKCPGANLHSRRSHHHQPQALTLLMTLPTP